MSLSYVEHARAVRRRLMNPPNAFVPPVVAEPKFIPVIVPPVEETRPSPVQPFEFHPNTNRHLCAGHRALPNKSNGFETPRHTMRDITSAVAFHCGFEVAHLHKRGRTLPVVTARQIAMYFCHEMTRRSYSEIGRYFDRDHTTVIHAKRRIVRLIRDDIEVAELVQKIRAGF